MSAQGPTAEPAADTPALRTRSTLSRVDYVDAFAIETGGAPELTGEEWARVVLEAAPAQTRRALRMGWTMLGLRLGAASDEERVLGWEVRSGREEVALLQAGSRAGLRGEVLFERRGRLLLFATFVQLGNPLARVAWGGIAPRHRRVVRSLLEHGVRRAERRVQPPLTPAG